ncbi:NblA/ycf18 family protein [Chroococcidiopsis sp. FACHB-1243]|uniref:NblA/ycf18 family protein n=1 Tax=Chroococcidiopsis sp. [FACHB-1243] TaxID=2692781 RepID=UPI001785DD3B|nr:NblA/ycf18 family protein [Chroococcidiopsis sp. [FACHB-1243]]MBD2306436.1 NblA/ycf18 family protein [Chroococcidiopsis sp. [FACHB-1243]]
MDRTIELTLEQEFIFRSFADRVRQMSREQAQELSILQYKHMIIQNMIYKGILKKDWQIELDFGLLKTKKQ